MDNFKRRRGRPKKKTPKYDQPVKVNLTQEQADKLDFLTTKIGMSRNDIMREALDSMYRLME
jgi:hypothetical protein